MLSMRGIRSGTVVCGALQKKMGETLLDYFLISTLFIKEGNWIGVGTDPGGNLLCGDLEI
jgi:hypothetical protein